jgi:undecaprenyl diphosphate synthase
MTTASPTDSSLPRHVGFILDGNGRWAERRNLPRSAGHEQGAKAVRALVRACTERGIPYVTLYAFSHLNWGRPRREVEALMELLPRFLDDTLDDLVSLGVRLQIVGETEDLPASLHGRISDALRRTAAGTRMVLTLAVSYSSRRDVVQAMRALAVAVQQGALLPEEIDEDTVRAELSTSGLPDPDLVVRTAGEMRMSDFLMLESSYAELHFTDALWPDFDEAELDRALGAYARRVRRFGRVSTLATPVIKRASEG